MSSSTFWSKRGRTPPLISRSHFSDQRHLRSAWRLWKIGHTHMERISSQRITAKTKIRRVLEFILSNKEELFLSGRNYFASPAFTVLFTQRQLPPFLLWQLVSKKEFLCQEKYVAKFCKNCRGYVKQENVQEMLFRDDARSLSVLDSHLFLTSP